VKRLPFLQVAKYGPMQKSLLSIRISVLAVKAVSRPAPIQRFFLMTKNILQSLTRHYARAAEAVQPAARQAQQLLSILPIIR